MKEIKARLEVLRKASQNEKWSRFAYLDSMMKLFASEGLTSFETLRDAGVSGELVSTVFDYALKDMVRFSSVNSRLGMLYAVENTTDFSDFRYDTLTGLCTDLFVREDGSTGYIDEIMKRPAEKQASLISKKLYCSLIDKTEAVQRRSGKSISIDAPCGNDEKDKDSESMMNMIPSDNYTDRTMERKELAMQICTLYKYEPDLFAALLSKACGIKDADTADRLRRRGAKTLCDELIKGLCSILDAEDITFDFENIERLEQLVNTNTVKRLSDRRKKAEGRLMASGLMTL